MVESVHPHSPFIGEWCFDDLYGMPASTSARLIFDGMVFCTEFENRGDQYGGRIIARDWDDARRIADERGIGEIISGQLEAIVTPDGE